MIGICSLMEHLLPTASLCRRHLHLLHRFSPLGACNHAAMMRAEPDQETFVAVCLPHELADVYHSIVGHVRKSRIADMSVMCPNDRLCTGPMVPHQPLQRFRHVPIANIP